MRVRVLLHSSRRRGAAAWPSATGDPSYVALDLAASPERNVDVLERKVPPQAVLFAHSAAAVPLALAVRSMRVVPQAVVLVEPALYDAVRGVPSIEHHIEAVTRARSLATAGDLFGYWSIIRPLMFGGPAVESHWADERRSAESFAAKRPPWGFGLDAAALDGVRTVVVTGAWNDEYEVIADALAQRGASRARLPGYGHRPQDHPDFERLVTDLLR
ncbi:hypothetical protein A4X16_13470 [Microbacterium sp. H83]|nr:hypothetical protein A4X16_13470 [Microbacterium sp. H83]